MNANVEWINNSNQYTVGEYASIGIPGFGVIVLNVYSDEGEMWNWLVEIPSNKISGICNNKSDAKESAINQMHDVLYTYLHSLSKVYNDVFGADLMLNKKLSISDLKDGMWVWNETDKRYETVIITVICGECKYWNLKGLDISDKELYLYKISNH